MFKTLFADCRNASASRFADVDVFITIASLPFIAESRRCPRCTSERKDGGAQPDTGKVLESNEKVSMKRNDTYGLRTLSIRPTSTFT